MTTTPPPRRGGLSSRVRSQRRQSDSRAAFPRRTPEGRPPTGVFRLEGSHGKFANRRRIDRQIASVAKPSSARTRATIAGSGQRLGLFAFDPAVGKGLPLWLPNGTAIREELEKLAKELEFKAGFERVATPHLARTALYERSGHLPYFAPDMYPLLEVFEQGERRGCEGHVRVAADELPSPPPRVRGRAEKLSRLAAAARRVRSGVSLGALRRAERHRAHARDVHERRAHLLHGRPGRAGAGRRARHVRRDLRAARHHRLSLSAVAARRERRARQVRRRTRSVGMGRSAPARRARAARRRV